MQPFLMFPSAQILVVLKSCEEAIVNTGGTPTIGVNRFHFCDALHVCQGFLQRAKGS